MDPTWQQIILHALPPTASQLTRATMSSANSLIFTLQLLSEIDTSIPTNSNVEIDLMGYLRATPSPDPLSYSPTPAQIDGPGAEVNFVTVEDRAMVSRILDEDAWSPEAAAALRRGEKIQGFARFVGGISDAKGMAMGQLDKVPLHKLGMRSDSDLVRDKEVVVNGFYVLR
jgi:hypothetical protein